MQAGVSTASLFLRAYNEDALTILNDLKISTTEIFLTTSSEHTNDYARLLLSRKGKLNINSVHTLNTNFEPQLYAVQDRVRRDAYNVLEDVMSSAEIFGAKYYTFHGVARLKKSFKGTNYDLMSKDTNEIIEVCKKHNVKLAYENVHWAYYATPGFYKEVKKRCPELCGVFDIKQARQSNYPYQMYLKDMEGSLAYAHLSDVDDLGHICLPGKGATDFVELFKRLKDIGFDGDVLIEVYKDDYKELKELKESCDFLNEIIYKVK